MSDIMKFIRNKDAIQTDPDGNLLDLDDWNEEIAADLAAQEGIELSEDHWDVIWYLREHFRDTGPAESARTLTELLDARYRGKGGGKYLYRLFPKGPVGQASRIAGLPLPPHSTDPSFGSSQ